MAAGRRKSTSVISITSGDAIPWHVGCGGTFQDCVGDRVKWSLRNHSRLSRATSWLRGSIETRRVLDELEWHRWFARYPVVVARDSELAYWAWLQFVERKTDWSRCTGEWVLRYRLALRRAQRAAPEPRPNRLSGSSSTIQQVQLTSGADYRKPPIDVVAFKATAILDLANYIVSDLNRQKRYAR
jgi:hypothetical protein